MSYLKIVATTLTTLILLTSALVGIDSYDSGKITKATNAVALIAKNDTQQVVTRLESYQLEQAQRRMDDLTSELKHDVLSERRRMTKESELVYRQREIDSILSPR